jgi:hypothetical protein
MGLLNWTLPTALNVYELALLSTGYDPAEYQMVHYTNWPKPVIIDTAPFLKAIKSAVLTGQIECEREYERNDYDRDIDWQSSLIDIKSYTQWLKDRGHEDSFFNCPFLQGEEGELDKLLSRSCPFCAPKLAAAVKAWLSVTKDGEALAGKSPKRALEIWLRKNANEFGLTGKDGKPNEQGIEEVSKVANWKPQGGAAKTPTPIPTKPAHPLRERGGKVASDPPTFNSQEGMDEEIPF